MNRVYTVMVIATWNSGDERVLFGLQYDSAADAIASAHAMKDRIAWAMEIQATRYDVLLTNPDGTIAELVHTIHTAREAPRDDVMPTHEGTGAVQ